MDTNALLKQEAYSYDTAAIFFRSKERYGLVSNMTGGMPLQVNDVSFQSSEGLDQAFKYPNNPEIQARIGSIGSGLFAKNVAYSLAYRPFLMPNWNDVRVDATIAILGIKLLQHQEKFGNALLETGSLPIVKRTPTSGTFWGAILQPNGTVIGGNALGKLLTELRDLLVETKSPSEAANQFLSTITRPKFLQVNGRDILQERE